MDLFLYFLVQWEWNRKMLGDREDELTSDVSSWLLSKTFCRM